MNSGHIIAALGRHINWRQGLLVPEAVVDCTARTSTYYGYGKRYQADLMWVTRDQYATEIEVKVSRSDWRADNAKDKWAILPGWVSRFVYAVPEALGMPDFVRPGAGIWHIVECPHWGVKVKVVRAPKRIGKERVPDWLMERWRDHLYNRYWFNYLHGPRRVLPALAAAAE